MPDGENHGFQADEAIDADEVAGAEEASDAVEIPAPPTWAAVVEVAKPVVIGLSVGAAFLFGVLYYRGDLPAPSWEWAARNDQAFRDWCADVFLPIAMTIWALVVVLLLVAMYLLGFFLIPFGLPVWLSRRGYLSLSRWLCAAAFCFFVSAAGFGCDYVDLLQAIRRGHLIRAIFDLANLPLMVGMAFGVGTAGCLLAATLHPDKPGPAAQSEAAG